MGTRNLTIVQADGEYKLAQYCQWDGYPGGAGSIVLEFLRGLDRESLMRFRVQVRALKEIDEKDYKAKWAECGADPSSDMVSVDVSEKFKKKYPHLQRDMGAEILDYIMKSKPGLEIQKQIEFAADSLFCEYAYVIDLDRGVFEIYMGFNQLPLKEGDRFFFLEEISQKAHRAKDSQYHPIRLIKSYKLCRLPQVSSFVKACDREGEAAGIIDDIRASKVEVPVYNSSVQVLNEILSERKNLPLLMGLSDDLDTMVEKRMKVLA